MAKSQLLMIQRTSSKRDGPFVCEYCQSEKGRKTMARELKKVEAQVVNVK